MKAISIIFFLFLVIFPFGQLNRLPVSLMPEAHLYLTDLVVAGLVGCWASWKLIKRDKLVLPPLAKPIFLFLIFAILSLIFNTPLLSNREVIVSGLYLLRWITYAGLYFVIFDLKKHFGQLKWDSVLRFLFVIGIMVAVFGLVQYALWPDLDALETLGWDPHYYRVVSTFLDPGFTGLILVLTLILIVVLGWKEKDKRPWFIAGLVVYLALTFTYSRSSYLAYLIGMGVIAWMKKTPKFLLAILLIGMVTLLVVPQPAGEGGKLGRKYTIEARIENWQNSLTIIGDHPLIGVGFNAYRYAQRDYGFLEEDEWQVSHAGAGADSSLLFVFATTGIFGFLAYLWLWLKIIQTKKLVILASAIALLAHSFFLNSLFYPWIMAWMWILLGGVEPFPVRNRVPQHLA